MPDGDSLPPERTPRNIVWVEDMPPAFADSDRQNLTISYYTHAIVSFFHIDAGPQLVYNGPGIKPWDKRFADWWPYLRTLREARNSKTLMMSVGGWESGTWANAAGQEAAAAKQIVEFAHIEGFTGIDFNFEGTYRTDPAHLRALANMVVEIRKVWGGILTITPMRDNVTTQLQYIQAALGPVDWRTQISWVNVQFYYYNGVTPVPQTNVPTDYDRLLLQIQAPPPMMAAGFPLSETDSGFNERELQYAEGAVRDIHTKHPEFAGLFVWRYRGAFRPQSLNWAYNMYNVLRGS
jgi:hypothetical protein